MPSPLDAPDTAPVSAPDKAADTTSLDLLIVGAGFGGLYMLVRARALGLSVRLIDAAPSVGGTWWHNRYPGARVDIESLEYSYSFSDELQQDWHWTERYAAQPELLRYANHVADRFNLRGDIQLNTRLTGAHFDDTSQRWLATTTSNTEGQALTQRWSTQFIVMATGPLSSPNTPAFDGLDSFAGPVLHTAHWPHQPVDFSGLRVGVIGTGSSGVQAIPLIAEQAKQLTVFQRTATYAVPAHNGPLDPALEARIKADYPGFRARNRRMRGGFGSGVMPRPQSALAVTADERQSEFERRWHIGGFTLLGAFNDLLTNHDANTLAAEFVRGKIASIVHDPVTAKLLQPQHTIGCKRLCVDSGYYATFNRPNVRLVDVSQTGIQRITPDGLDAGGQHHQLDALVLATGFDAMTGTLLRLDLRGRGGLPLQDKWQAGPLNCLGLMVAGFPNLFNMVGPGSTSAFTNVIPAIEHHVDWIARTIAHVRGNGLATIEPTLQAEAEWTEHVQAAARQTVFLSCNSWYLGANIAGKPRIFMPLAGGFPQYVERCDKVAASGYPGFVLA